MITYFCSAKYNNAWSTDINIKINFELKHINNEKKLLCSYAFHLCWILCHSTESTALS